MPGLDPPPNGGDRPPPCDTCDTKLADVSTATLTEPQRRFLAAYRERLAVAPAARLAGVHRATVYRWRADPAFAAAMRAAAEGFFAAARAAALAEEAIRQAWRDERERRRHPMRCHYLARARAAKRR